MHMDQRQVTAIDLQDGRVRDIVLLKDSWSYKLSFVSKDDVVNLRLSAQDLQKLLHAVDRSDRNAIEESPPQRAEKHDAASVAVATCPGAVDPPDWISFN